MNSTDKPTSKKSGAIGPVQQFQLLLYATKDTELTACDLAVLAELTDRFLKDGPQAGKTRPTSARHLARETGRDDASTHRSLMRLSEWGYITLEEIGTGRRGNTYTLPFEWVRHIASEIYAFVKGMADAKKRRRKRHRSDRTDTVASTLPVVTAPTRTLRSFVTAPTRYLVTVVTASLRDQSYGLPKSRPIGADMSAGTLRVPPPVVSKKIQSAVLSEEGGETTLVVEYENGDTDFIVTESADADVQEEGQKELETFAASTGLPGINQPKELVGRTVHKQAGRFVPAPANDNVVLEDDAAPTPLSEAS